MVHLFARDTIYRLASVALLVLLSPCKLGLTESPPFTIITTTNIIADTARSIAGTSPGSIPGSTPGTIPGTAAETEGGTGIVITPLMREGVDPHTYKPSPGDLRALSQASLILFNGLHLEGKMADVFEKLSKRQPVVAVTDSIAHDRLRTTSTIALAHDPHVWFDVSLWILASERIRDALSEYNPAHKAGYHSRFAALRERLLALDLWCASELSTIPQDSRLLVTSHDAFGYFGAAYDIEVLGVQGVSTDSEASLRDINNLVRTLTMRRIPAVFIETSVSPKMVEALVEGARAQGHAISIGGTLFSDSLGSPATPEGTYEGMVRHNVTTIKKALSRGK